ncbi:hypothetical protein [Legionella sp. km772]|uniref:hypothetical protein n=1 Tax=Legionella sp. km772 TaxID=2498111 RepID=UPI000F8DE35E|nr:hypothetical protein [Legionella sp. km772]RUR05883.1 hypothetical protein ELY15_13775 [Legionella sp. km772]
MNQTLANFALQGLLLMMLFIPIGQANAHSWDFFSNKWHDNEALLVLHYKAGYVENIHSASFAFFGVDDCQKDLLAYYKTPLQEKAPFAIRPLTKFALLGDKIYQIATGLLPTKDIHSIQSLLIRFRGKNKELPRFLSACADEGVNCCVAIQCSNDAGICLPKFNFPAQSFIFFSDYN